MCGICGFISYEHNYIKSALKERQTAKRMADTMYSRGPDAGGVGVGEHAVFSHRRLAVIDPEGGAQPMKGCARAMNS